MRQNKHVSLFSFSCVQTCFAQGKWWRYLGITDEQTWLDIAGWFHIGVSSLGLAGVASEAGEAYGL